MIEMYTTGEAIVTESQLNDVEKYFGVKFPQAYIDFMLVTNGAIPLHGCFDSKDGTESSNVTAAMSISTQKFLDVCLERDSNDAKSLA